VSGLTDFAPSEHHKSDFHEAFGSPTAKVVGPIEDGGTNDSDPPGLHCALGQKSSRLENPLTTDAEKASSMPDWLTNDDGSPMTLRDAKKAYDRFTAGEYNSDEFGNTLQQRAKKKYRALQDKDRRLRREFDDCHIVHFALTGSPKDDEDRWIPPLDFIEALNESMSSVSSALRYALAEYDSEWYAVLAGSEDKSVPHWHYVAYLDGEVSASDFERVIEKHPKHSPVARPEDHELEHISVRRAAELELKPYGRTDREKGVTSPIAPYVGSQLPHIAGASGRSHELAHGAVMAAYSGQHLRPRGVLDDDLSDDDTEDSDRPGLHCALEEKSEQSDDRPRFAFQRAASGDESSPGPARSTRWNFEESNSKNLPD
jgi:hypothetical protein